MYSVVGWNTNNQKILKKQARLISQYSSVTEYGLDLGHITEDCVLESKDKIEDIDLEEGKIRIDGKWLTEDEIRYAIKMKISSDDYNVADLAVALRTLIDEMNKSQILKVRLPKDLVEELETLSKEKDESVEAMLRKIITDHMRSPPEAEEEFEPEEEDEEDDEDYNDIEIGFRSRAAEEEAQEVEPEITVEAQPIEAVVAEEEVSIEEVEVPEAQIEEDIKDIEEILEDDNVIPEDDVEEEIDIEEVLEEEIETPEDENILGIDEEEEIVVEEEEPEEVGEEIELGEEPKEEAVQEGESATEEKDEGAPTESEKDEDKKLKKRLIPRRKKLLRRRP
jgi:hypothetical protein